MFFGWARVCTVHKALPWVQMWAPGAPCPTQGWPPSCRVPGHVLAVPPEPCAGGRPCSPVALLLPQQICSSGRQAGTCQGELWASPPSSQCGQTWWVTTEVQTPVNSRQPRCQNWARWYFSSKAFYTERKKKEERKKKILPWFSGTKVFYEFMPFPLCNSFSQGKSTQ